MKKIMLTLFIFQFNKWDVLLGNTGQNSSMIHSIGLHIQATATGTVLQFVVIFNYRLAMISIRSLISGLTINIH